MQKKKFNVHVSNLSVIQTRDYGSIISQLYQQCTTIYIKISTVSRALAHAQGFI